MELQSLAKTLAFLTILEPGSKTCELIIKLAKAGTTTAGEGKNDTATINEIRTHLPELQKELESIKPAQLKTCELIIKLAKAGATTGVEEKTDTAIIKEIKEHLPALQKELADIKPAKFEAVENIMVKILTPDA